MAALEGGASQHCHVLLMLSPAGFMAVLAKLISAALPSFFIGKASTAKL